MTSLSEETLAWCAGKMALTHRSRAYTMPFKIAPWKSVLTHKSHDIRAMLGNSGWMLTQELSMK